MCSLSSTMSADSLLAKLSVLETRSTYEERALGDVFCGWKTVRHLGSGSHGRCFLMRKPDDTLVVHKRVPVSHMRPEEQEAAEREVNILAAFNHPYIIRYDHAFVRQGQLNIVMEHASGGDLGGHLRALVEEGQRPSVATVLDWFVQLLLALECVHSCRVRRAADARARLPGSPASPAAHSHRPPRAAAACAAAATPSPRLRHASRPTLASPASLRCCTATWR